MIQGGKFGSLISSEWEKAACAIKKLFYAKTPYGNSLANSEIQWIYEWAQGKSKKHSHRLFRKALQNRILHKTPLQYILQTQPFHGMTIHCLAPVFIPRPETEHWVDWLLQRNTSMHCRVLDLCTGTGCIGLSLAKKNPSWTVWCVDVDKKACALAKKNKTVNNIENAFILHGNLYKALTSAPGRCSLKSWQNSQNFDGLYQTNFSSFFDLIVANPPYISIDEYKDLPFSVKNYESAISLIGNKTLAHRKLTRSKTKSNVDFLQYYKEIIDSAPSFLKKTSSCEIPSLVLEIGSGSQRILQLFGKEYSNVNLHADYAGKERVISASFAPT